MSRKPFFSLKSDYQHDKLPGMGVLLVNVGTPSAPTTRAVRHYLAEFLSDSRVIEMPRWLWWLILHGIILRIRPARSAKAYSKIWTPEGSPLWVHNQELAQKLGAKFAERYAAPIRLKLAMRYGQPSLANILDKFRQEKIRRLLIVPLYPQYCAATTASVFDEVTRILHSWRWLPELRFINGYHDTPDYIQALTQSIQTYWQNQGKGEHLLISFHGIPERYFQAGDPYFCFCQKTARLLAEQLQLASDQYSVSFQSRVGVEDWLRPYTVDRIEQLARQGVRRLQVICPGFAVDCLETLEEIAMEARTAFLSAGGEHFDYIPALNSLNLHVDMLTKIITRHGQGWPELDPDWSVEAATEDTKITKTLFEQKKYA